MEILDRQLLESLTNSGPRLPDFTRWLVDEVWTQARFKAAPKPAAYLEEGEALVNGRESLMSGAGDSLFSELTADPGQRWTIGDFFNRYPDGAVVVLDGCSLREFPRLIELARASKRPVIEKDCGRAALPSDTEDFVSDRLGLGLPRLSPSQLTGRGELRERNVKFYYFGRPSDTMTIEDGPQRPLLWSRFPDQRYLDSHANSSDMFEGIWETMSMVWQRTVQAISPKRPILVTSDHGYIFLGGGLSDRNLDRADQPLGGKRFRIFEAGEPLPESRPGLIVDKARRLGILAGRCHNRPPAPSSSQSIYRHGGVSLMEMLTPWLVLGPAEIL